MLKPICIVNCFLFFLLFSVTSAQTKADSVIERFRWTGSSDAVVYTVATVFGFAIVGIIIVYIIQTKIKAKGIKEFANLQFAKRANDARLNIAEQTLLKSISWIVAPKMFADVFNSLVLFENAVDLEIRRLVEKYGENNKKTEDAAEMMHFIRRKLGFDKLIPEKALESTRNIEYGQVITLFNPLGGASIGMTRMLNNDELYLEVDFTDLHDYFSKSGQQNGGVIAKFTRQQDAAYSVLLLIHSINIKEKTISFYHTTSLERSQSRNYARISVDTPVQCRVIKRTEEKTEPFAGEILKDTLIIDVSGGGLAFMSKVSLSIDDIAMFSFTLNKQKLVMKGKIIAISTQGGRHDVYFKHRVIFYNPKQSDIERIIKFIYEKQRERIQFG